MSLVPPAIKQESAGQSQRVVATYNIKCCSFDRTLKLIKIAIYLAIDNIFHEN